MKVTCGAGGESSSSPILVHEYVMGGGWPSPDLPVSLGAEALAMQRAVLQDFASWGEFPIVATRDVRLRDTELPARRVVELDSADYPDALVDLARTCSAALIIAPEGGGVLEGLSRRMEEAGTCLLGCSSQAVAVAADKWECFRRLRAGGVPVPQTRLVAPGDAAGVARDVGYPVVVKPVSGAGCSGVAFVPGPEWLGAALEQPAIRSTPRFLMQRYIPGVAASVSLLVAGMESRAIGFNEQLVHLGVPIEYEGGVALSRHLRRGEALDLAKTAVALLPGLRGYVGVDLVLAEDASYVIEINPRITTSYVGLRRGVGINLAEAIWRACRRGALPAAVPAGSPVAFRKDGHETD